MTALIAIPLALYFLYEALRGFADGWLLAPVALVGCSAGLIAIQFYLS